MEEKTLKNCIFIKTILMLMVMLGHACAFWSGEWFTKNPAIQSTELHMIYFWMNSFHIYAFALVSGYIFAYKIRGGGYRHYLPFLKNKAKRLLIPYVFVMVLWVAPLSAYFMNWDLPYLIKKYVLCIEPSQLWFLWMLFGVFAIMWLLWKPMTKNPTLGWILAIAIYGIGIGGNKVLPNVFCIWTALQYVPIFFMGMRIRIKEENGEKSITKTIPCSVWIVLDLLVFGSTVMFDGMTGKEWVLAKIVLTFFLHIVGAIMAFTMLQELATACNWKDNRFFRTLSSYSMPMYLFHQQIIYFTIIWLNGKVNPWLNVGANFAAAFLGSFLISAVLMRWKFTRFLVGEKKGA